MKTITFDALDRMLLESYGVGARENTAYSWDQHGSKNDPGQLLAVTRGTGLVAKYTYDPNARRLERTVENASLSYSLGMSDTFDVGGAIIRQRIPGGAGFGFGYDAFRRLRSITFGQGTDSVPVLSDARYRSNDLVDGYRLGARLRANYGYESQRSFMTTNKVVRHPAGNPTAVQDTLLLQKLEWDASGNVAGMQRPIGDTLGYRHDRLGQLRATARAGGMDSLQYDANGNRVRHRFTLDGGVPDSLAYNANRVAWMRTARNGHTLFRHDVLGNLTLEAHFASAADTTDLSKAWKIVERKFNRRNELERVVVKDRQTMDSTLWAYDYDEAGNRIMKRYAANLDTTQWKTERRYAYDGVNVVADSGRGDSSWTWHVFQGYNRLALADKPGSALRVKYLLNDHLGTANVMVDDTGRVLAKYARDPWGNLESSWESTPLRWQFTGKEQDPEVGGNVFYFNARFYDGERGTFAGRDIAEQFWTPYSYTGNGPLGGIDPTGMWMNFSSARSRANDNVSQDMSRYSKNPFGAAAGRNDFKILHALNNFHFVNEMASEITGTYNPIVNFLPKTILSAFALIYDVAYEVKTAFKGAGGHAFDDQPVIDWLYDTPGDMVANGYGLGVGLVWPGMQTSTGGRRAGDWVFLPVYAIPGPQHQNCGQGGMNCSNLLDAGVIASRPSWWPSASDDNPIADYLNGDNPALDRIPGGSK